MSSRIIQVMQIISGALVAFFLTCGEAIADMSFYANQEKGFCIEFPENWHVQPDPVVVVCATKFLSEVSGDENVPPNIKVGVSKLEGGKKLQDYYDYNAKVHSTIWKVIEAKDVEIGGCPAKRIDLEQKLGIIETRVVKAFVQSGDNIFVISCSADPIAFSQYKTLFDSSINSFKPIVYGGSKPASTVGAAESTVADPSKADTPKVDAAKTDTPQPDPGKVDSSKLVPPKAELLKLDEPSQTLPAKPVESGK